MQAKYRLSRRVDADEILGPVVCALLVMDRYSFQTVVIAEVRDVGACTSEHWQKARVHDDSLVARNPDKHPAKAITEAEFAIRLACAGDDCLGFIERITFASPGMSDGESE
jgi:hypothetical protein